LIEDGLHRDKVSAIPNSLDLDRYPLADQNCQEVKSALGFDPHEPIVGTAGRLHKRKNVQMFLQAAKRLLDDGVRARFLIVGDGPMRSELEKLTSELGIAEHVHFAGWRTDIISVMRAMDIFVLCSYAEAWPIVILEALALQKPTVSTAVGGIPEIIENGQNGILIPSGDPGCLKKVLQDLLQKPEKARQIAHAGRKSIAQKYSDKVMVEKTYQVYHELMHSN
jgi:glycosyltransferase involved in cell wall biosynthesis